MDTSSFEVPSSRVFYDPHDTVCYLHVTKQCTYDKHFHERNVGIALKRNTFSPQFSSPKLLPPANNVKPFLV